MLCLCGFELYSRWVPLQIFCHNSFLCVLLSPEVTCEHAWSLWLCWLNECQLNWRDKTECNKGLRVVNKINASCDC